MTGRISSSISSVRVNPISTLVEYLEYSKPDQVMRVKYKRGKHKGKVRKYYGVKNEEFLITIDSQSIGKSVLLLVKDKRGEYESFSFKDKFLSFFI